MEVIISPLNTLICKIDKDLVYARLLVIYKVRDIVNAIIVIIRIEIKHAALKLELLISHFLFCSIESIFNIPFVKSIGVLQNIFFNNYCACFESCSVDNPLEHGFTLISRLHTSTLCSIVDALGVVLPYS